MENKRYSSIENENERIVASAQVIRTRSQHTRLAPRRVLIFIMYACIQQVYCQKVFINQDCMSDTYINLQSDKNIYFYGNYSKKFVGKWLVKDDTILFYPISNNQFEKLNLEHFKKKYSTNNIIRDTLNIVCGKSDSNYGVKKNKYLYINRTLYIKYISIYKPFRNFYDILFPIDIAGKRILKLTKKKQSIIKRYFTPPSRPRLSGSGETNNSDNSLFIPYKVDNNNSDNSNTLHP